MNILAWAIIGLIAGAIAKAIYPGEQGSGFLGTMLLGMLGSQVGGWIGRQFLDLDQTTARSFYQLTQEEIMFNLATAVAGAIAILFIWGILTRPSR